VLFLQLDLTDNDVTLSDDGEYKMVLVVRTDLKMGKGKAAAQVKFSSKPGALEAFSYWGRQFLNLFHVIKKALYSTCTPLSIEIPDLMA